MTSKKFLLFFLIQLFLPLEAHNRSESYSKFQFLNLESGVEVKITGTSKRGIFEALNPGIKFQSYEDFINYLGDAIFLGDACKLNQPVEFNENNAAGVLKFYWDFQCSTLPSNVSISLFQDLGVTHTHIARGVIDGETIPEFMFASQTDLWQINSLSQSNRNQSSYWGYLISGIEHILSGWDHLAFLLGLILLFQGRNLVIAITGFTIGHSLTLALGALNLINPSSQLVEALIGYSIIIIAVECVSSITKSYKLHINILSLMWFILLIGLLFLGYQKFLIGLIGMGIFSYCYLNLISRHKDFSLTIFVTCLFGLIHGFGFAGNLSNIGLMEGRLLPAIFGFNLGVELGQILVVCIFLSISLIVNRFLKQDLDQLRVYAASGLACIGTFWFLERLF